MLETSHGDGVRHPEQPKALDTGIRVIKISLISYAIIILGKILAGFLLDVEVLRVDGLHDLTDVFSLLSVYMATIISKKSPDKKFPYGYMKFDSIVSLFLSVVFLIASYFVIVEGFEKLIHPSYPATNLVPVIVSSISTVVTFFISRNMLKTGNELNINSLAAIGRDKYLDSFMGIAIIASLVFIWLEVPFIEGIVIIVLGFLIVASAVISAKDSILGLMDTGMKQEDLKNVEKILENDAKIKDFKSLKFRKVGAFYFGEVSLIIPPHISSEQAVYVTKEIKDKILQENKKIAHLSVTIDIPEDTIKNIMIPIQDRDLSMESPLSDHFGRAPYYIFVTVDTAKNEVVHHDVESNPHVDKEVRAGLAAIKNLTKDKTDVLITKNLGEIAFFTLQQKLIEILKVSSPPGVKITVNDAIKQYLEGKLPKHQKPTRKKD